MTMAMSTDDVTVPSSPDNAPIFLLHGRSARFHFLDVDALPSSDRVWAAVDRSYHLSLSAVGWQAGRLGWREGRPTHKCHNARKAIVIHDDGAALPAQ